MITLHKIRELDVVAAASGGRPAHLSAASGLVCTDTCIYVIADDELHLGMFHASENKPGQLIRLFPGELPATSVARKARKPDLESLMRLPSFSGCPHGALFALGSGSTPNRSLGALLALDARGDIHGSVRVIELAPLFSALDNFFPALNIEGGLVNGGDLCLLQRGNQSTGHNALIRFELAPLLEALGSRNSVPSLSPLAVNPLDLGSIGGTPLSLTDGAALANGDIVFSAVAEDTRDHYHDGPCVGAAIGLLNRQGALRCLHPLDQPHKIEGVHASAENGIIRLLLVTDADDAAIPAGLFSANLALP